ncbi:MAG: UTP--glucose-1-phosphate uridylyltransferase [candidate division WS2 bacterium ADurb.Bin280]|uniref:UTP--glucose-1-phosphate uridylyltransferase n=1 Tax=candidate division WS2 bacterium ADurb.Bin280 TaxID=1852829 RepID=A0A1V5SFX4_9BACT|nr:MAG: UTP--glucose-1-phosphate uridylyltransferase [candidate division WS2 bacterium ADurb.Bin280]
MKITKAVFPVAGLGTRFLPATKAQPKEMLPLVDKPIIQYAVEEAVEAGLDLMVLVTGKGKQSIENHFDTSFELEEALEKKGKTQVLEEIRKISSLGKFVYVRQQQPPLGLGHAVLMAKEIVGNEYFAVFLPDDVMDCPVACMKQMVEVHQKTSAAIIAAEKTDALGQERYGILKVEPTDNPRLHRIVDIVEKPGAQNAPSDLAVMGRYILPPEIFEKIEQTGEGAIGEIQLTDAIKSLLGEKEFFAYEYEGERHDAGEVSGYLKATIKLGLKRSDISEDLKKFIDEIAS